MPNNIFIRMSGAEAAAVLTSIHSECFPHYWDSSAFTDFFSVGGTFALLAEIAQPVGADGAVPPPAGGRIGGGRIRENSILSRPHPGPPPAGEGESIAVGMLVCRRQGDDADIMTLAVRPAWRQRGVAHTLVEAAIAGAVMLGAKNMFLDVEDGNSAALRLYEGFGFAQINRRKLYYRQKDGSYTDALVMMKKIV